MPAFPKNTLEIRCREIRAGEYATTAYYWDKTCQLKASITLGEKEPKWTAGALYQRRAENLHAMIIAAGGSASLKYID
mgnify:CR=1 FL=1